MFTCGATEMSTGIVTEIVEFQLTDLGAGRGYGIAYIVAHGGVDIPPEAVLSPEVTTAYRSFCAKGGGASGAA